MGVKQHRICSGTSEQRAFGLEEAIIRSLLITLLDTLGLDLGLLLGVQALTDLLGVTLVVEFKQPVQHLDLHVRRNGEPAALASFGERCPEPSVANTPNLRENT